MPVSSPYRIHQLTADDITRMYAMLAMFGEEFGEAQTYTSAMPTPAYLADLLGSRTFIALAALQGDTVVGGLAAYELRKFEQQRSEIYIYDLAVAAAHRRNGIATKLIETLKVIAAQQGAWVVFVQADRSDAPAIALYEKLGSREDVLHFDIAVD